jgi:hypothetical protein
MNQIDDEVLVKFPEHFIYLNLRTSILSMI